MHLFGIGQHARQLTVSLRDQHGDVIPARQVSTQSEKVFEFFDQHTRECAAVPDEVVKPIRDWNEVKSFERKAG